MPSAFFMGHINGRRFAGWRDAGKKVAKKRVAGPDFKWWTDARFGMFIHWGLYAAAARHEWVRHGERITNEDYQKYFDHFDPDLYDPREWARAAKQAGMRYFVITTKHHEGFCLWDSKHTDYKATKTPYGKDLLKADGEGLPRRRHPRRALLLAHRLAPSGVPYRYVASATRRQGLPRTAEAPRRAEVCRIHAEPGEGAAHAVRAD